MCVRVCVRACVCMHICVFLSEWHVGKGAKVKAFIATDSRHAFTLIFTHTRMCVLTLDAH